MSQSQIHSVVTYYSGSLDAYVSDCKCGWASSKRGTYTEALRDGEGHHVGPRSAA